MSEPWQDWYCEAKSACSECLKQGAAFVTVVRSSFPPPEGQGLTDCEIRRRAGLRLESDRASYTLARLLVRKLLLPDHTSLPFSKTAMGKPFLPGQPNFNISHTREAVAVIICRSDIVGIDIEASCRARPVEPLIDLVCHPNERRFLDTTMPERRTSEFLRCWTRKEALLKAVGTGLTNELTSLDTHLPEARPTVTTPVRAVLWQIETGMQNTFCTAALGPEVEELSLWTG